MASYSQSLLKGHSLATHSPGSCPLVNASEGKKKFQIRALSICQN